MSNIVKADPEASQKLRSKRILKIAGGFLVLMLLLTFFSNTINNLSLPRIKVENPLSGTLSREVKGSGEVLAKKETKQAFDEAGVKIIEVLAKQGDSVEKGQVLVRLEREEPDTTDIDALVRALEKRKKDFEKKKNSYEEPDQFDLDVAATEAHKAYQKATETYWEAVDAYNEAVASPTSVAPNVDDYDTQSEYYDAYQAYLKAAAKEQKENEKTLRSAEEAYSDAKLAYFKFVRTQEKDKVSEEQKYQDFLDELEEERQNIKLDEQAIAKKREEENKETEIKAESTGVLKEINAKVDEKTSAETIFVIVDPTAGFEFKCPLTREMVKRLAVRDSVDLQIPEGSGRYVRGAVREFKDIKDDPQKQDVYIDLEAEGLNLLGGESGGLEITKRSRTYDMLLPNAAVREDQDSRFILIMNEERGPLGNTYIVKRMDVEVIEKDNFKTAISTSGSWPENVVVSSDKPISDKSRVMPER